MSEKITVFDVVKQLKDIFEGKTDPEAMHNTGFIEMCGKTADDVIRQIKEEERNEGNK